MLGYEKSTLELQSFDAEYVRRLTAGDPATESHFSLYFEKFLSFTLRARRISPELAEDVRQETLFRVLKILRKGAGVTRPESFGSFVNSVSRNVLSELQNKPKYESAGAEVADTFPDQVMDTLTSLIDKERKKLVAAILDELSPKDREILRLVFFEQADRKEICAGMKVDGTYLRVLLHRAKAKFRAVYVGKRGTLVSFILPA